MNGTRLLLTTFAFAVTLGACNTTAGAGKDINLPEKLLRRQLKKQRNSGSIR